MVNNMKKKLIAVLTIILVLATCLMVFASCHKKSEPMVYTNVYKNTSSAKEYTSSRLLLTLPANISIVTESSGVSSGGDYGYIKDIDAFVVKDSVSGFLNLVKSGESKAMITATGNPGDYGFDLTITAIRVKNNLIAVLRTDGTAEVYNLKGKVVISKNNFMGTNGAKIDTVLKILNNELVAVAPKYDKNINDASSTVAEGYTCIYRASTGLLQGRVTNENKDINLVEGYDNYVAVVPASDSTTKLSRIVKVPNTTTITTKVIEDTERSTFKDNGEGSEYFYEVTYVGNGRFFVYEDWQVSVDGNYTYYSEDESTETKTYYLVKRHIYNAENDKLDDYVSDVCFMNITNKYNASTTKTGITADQFLNDGYMYASYCVLIDPLTKRGEYDQMILDDNFNIVISLTGNFGITGLRPKNAEDVGFFDLMVKYIDNIGIVSFMPSVMRAYDIYGNVIFENKDTVVTTAAYNDGMIIASTVKDEKTYYGAFNMQGELVIPFEYGTLTSYMGDYCYGKRTVKNGNQTEIKYELIGRDGVVVQTMSDHSVPLADVASDSSGNPITRVGVYMYKIANSDTTYSAQYPYWYGIKNFNTDTSKNIIEGMNALQTNFIGGTSLYSPKSNPDCIFVIGKLYNDAHTYVYRIV